MSMKLAFKSFLVPRDLGWNRVRAVCGHTDCHNKLLTKYVPGSRIGINVGEIWYCSPDCFAAGLRGVLASLAMSCVEETPRTPRLSLGLALLAKGHLSEAQLRAAVVESQLTGARLETVLVEQGTLGEKQLAAGRAAQWGYPVLGQDLIVHDVEADLPTSLLRACSAVPIHYSAKTPRLVLGFVHRVEHGLLQAIEQIVGFRPEVCFITPAEFNEQMARLKHPEGYQEAVIGHPGAVSQMGRTLGGFALEFSASQATLVRCKSFIWARVAGKHGGVDVVFDMKVAAETMRPEFSTVALEPAVAGG